MGGPVSGVMDSLLRLTLEAILWSPHVPACKTKQINNLPKTKTKQTKNPAIKPSWMVLTLAFNTSTLGRGGEADGSL